MSTAALIAWVLTAGGGFVMLAIWLSGGGLKGGASATGGTTTRFQPRLIFSHFGLAALGLVVWLVFMLTDAAALAWIAAALLLPVAGLGFSMLAKWLGGRASARRDEQPEQRFPVAVVVLHGLAAVTTLVLVVIAAVKAL